MFVSSNAIRCGNKIITVSSPQQVMYSPYGLPPITSISYTPGHLEETIQESYKYAGYVNGRWMQGQKTPTFKLPQEIYQIKDILIIPGYPPLHLQKDANGLCNLQKSPKYRNHPDLNTRGTYNTITNQCY